MRIDHFFMAGSL